MEAHALQAKSLFWRPDGCDIDAYVKALRSWHGSRIAQGLYSRFQIYLKIIFWLLTRNFQSYEPLVLVFYLRWIPWSSPFECQDS